MCIVRGNPHIFIAPWQRNYNVRSENIQELQERARGPILRRRKRRGCTGAGNVPLCQHLR